MIHNHETTRQIPPICSSNRNAASERVKTCSSAVPARTTKITLRNSAGATTSRPTDSGDSPAASFVPFETCLIVSPFQYPAREPVSGAGFTGYADELSKR